MNTYVLLKYSIFGLLALVTLLLIIVLLTSNPTELLTTGNASASNCIPVNAVDSLRYSGCYDAFSNFIYFEVHNENHLDTTTNVRVSFFDYTLKTFTLEAPVYNRSSFTKFVALKNPLSIEVYLEDRNKNYCNTPIDVAMTYCPAELADKGSTTSLNLVSTMVVENFTEVYSTQGDTVPVSLIDAEKVWEGICSSEWACTGWGACTEDVQKRTCTDQNRCLIPTNVPREVQRCEATCQEDWHCEWSECRNGVTTPTCVDQNRCGTSQDKPVPVACAKACEPNIECTDWGACESNYDFLTLRDGNISLKGSQFRSCIDTEGCVAETRERRSCSLAIDIYTQSFTKCGKDYIGIYNALDNALLANIEKATSYYALTIDLSGKQSQVYCDFCFNGIQDGDEEQIDCGGSCPSCAERVVDETYAQTFTEKILEAILGLVS